MRRTVLVILSDTHAGHRLALMNPETLLWEEDQNGELVPYHPEQTESQKYLWNLYLQNIEEVKKLAGKDEILVIHNGDECQGNKYKQQLVSTRDGDQIEIAEMNMMPWYIKNVKHIRFSASTSAHNFGENTSTLNVIARLQRRYPKVDTQLARHGLLHFNGISIDYAHHGPYPGSRSWLKGNVATYYLKDLMMKEIMRGNRPPDIVARAHYHEGVFVHLEVREYESRLIITPSYSMLGDYGQQATRSISTLEHGLFAFELVDGKIVDKYLFSEKIDIRREETL